MSGARSSRLPGFFRLDIAARRRALGLEPEANPGALPLDVADAMIENVVGTFELPLGVVTNLVVNGRECVAPAAVEEPSIVAAASNAAKMARAGGGFRAISTPPWMIAQVQVDRVGDPAAASARLREAEPELAAAADAAVPGIVRRGGGWRGLELRDLGGGLLVVHGLVDVRDAMGANAVDAVAEALGDRIAELAGGRLGLRILSNLADRRRVVVDVDVPAGELGGADVAERIEGADRFAWADPYRAATHNKGVLNGIDAVLLACGQDWRGVEAGAHAWAARDGAYRPLTRWNWDAAKGVLRGRLELPMAVGTVGGALRAHPGARRCIELCAATNAEELGQIAASVGIANNLAALRALVTRGIQEGHMRLHARALARDEGSAPRYWTARRLPPEVEPEWLLALPEARGSGRTWFAGRDGGAVAGIGEASVLREAGAEAARRCLAGLVPLGAPPDGAESPAPVLLGGFAFAAGHRARSRLPWDPFGPARFVLPESSVHARGDARWLLLLAPRGLSAGAAETWLESRAGEMERALLAAGAQAPGHAMPLCVEPGPEPDVEPLVRAALAAIARDGLGKLTVAAARRFRVQPLGAAAGVDGGRATEAGDLPLRLLLSLRRRQPGCFGFLVEPAGGGPAFVGASPERLLAVHGPMVSADALAGTAPRGADAQQDARFAAALLASPKERREHAAVLDWVVGRLRPALRSLEAPPAPDLRALRHVWHLHSPVRGQRGEAAGAAGLLELAARLHPTPAVAGVPGDAALDWIGRHEGLDRGWYAGALGVVRGRGEGELCVALRCALVDGADVWAFAGAGIVEGSLPAREAAEIARKMLAVAEALGDGSDESEPESRAERAAPPAPSATARAEALHA
jgi:hydroxymethylglutaryl-CoA reductase